MRGSLQERSAVLHINNNKHDRANQSLLRIRLTVVPSADRGLGMCASPLLYWKTPVYPKLQLSVGRFSVLVVSLWARALRGCGAAAAQSESVLP